MADFINKLSVIWTDYRYIIAPAAFLVWLLIGWKLVHITVGLARKFVKKTETRIDDLILEEAKLPIWFILIIVGFFLVSRTIGFPQKVVPYIDRFSQLSIVFLIVYFVSRIVLNLIKAAGRINVGLKNMLPTYSRFANLIIWIVGILMLMDIFGISITPALASLGIAGLAIGLALQDTLGNFFSGVYVLLSQPIRVGDYIELENGLKGYVTNIGWRETRIRTLPNNTVIIPNSKLSQSIITNYYLPQKEMACLVQVGVSYESDLEKVERVTVEVAKQIQEKVSGGVSAFDPFIRYHTFADFSVNFTVILRVSEFVDKYLLTHEFVKALHKRYAQEGIVIPFPIRTLKLPPSFAERFQPAAVK